MPERCCEGEFFGDAHTLAHPVIASVAKQSSLKLLRTQKPKDWLDCFAALALTTRKKGRKSGP